MRQAEKWKVRGGGRRWDGEQSKLEENSWDWDETGRGQKRSERDISMPRHLWLTHCVSNFKFKCRSSSTAKFTLLHHPPHTLLSFSPSLSLSLITLNSRFQFWSALKVGQQSHLLRLDCGAYLSLSVFFTSLPSHLPHSLTRSLSLARSLIHSFSPLTPLSPLEKLVFLDIWYKSWVTLIIPCLLLYLLSDDLLLFSFFPPSLSLSLSPFAGWN